MQTKEVQILTLDSILDQTQKFSQLSLPASFDLKDIQNQKPEQTHMSDDYDNFFEQQDDTVSISLTKKSKSRSETTKTVSKIDHIRSMSVIVKDQTLRNFVLKQTVIDQKVFAKNVTFMNIANVSKPFEVSNKLVGLPTSIYATSSKFLAVGTSQSSVALFEMGVKNYRLMETVNKNKYGSTTSIAICKQNLFMVCGYQNGYLTIWDLSTFSLIKTIQSQMNNESILKLQFVRGKEFISSDIQGNVMLYSIEKYVWTSVKSKRLITQSASSVYYDIRGNKLVNNKYAVALVSYNSLVLITIDPVEVIYKFERPQTAPSNSVPVADIGLFKNQQTQQNYVLISWGSKLYFYLYNPLSRTQPFQLKHTYQHSLSLVSIQIISSTAFILLDSSGIYKIFNLYSLMSNLPNSIKSQGLLKNDILIGKCSIQDTKYKNTSNTVCKTIDNFNEIFFITQGGMFRCRFHKWTEMIYYLIQNKEYLQALKCAIEIFNGRLDIFSQKVVISPKTMVLFNDMITYYLNIRLKQIRTLSPEQIKQIIITSIQYCVEIQSYQHLFTKIFSIIFHTYHLQKIFIQSLQIFIRSHLIKRIPNFIVLQKIINYYTVEDSSVVDILILSIDPLSIDYYATLDVCVNHKLYSSLIYISEINNDFVSPANKIIQACEDIRDKGGNMNIVEEYTSLIYLQMIKLLEGKTIAGTPLGEKSKELGISTLSLWFTIEQNMKDLVNYNGVLYFEILEKLFDNEIVIQSFRQSKEQNWHLKLILELKRLAAGYKEYQQALVNIVLKINEIKELNKEMVEYCLKNLGSNVNKKSLQKFVDKNSTVIEELFKNDASCGSRLPNQLKGLIFINNKNYQQALDVYQKLPNQQIDTLFTHLNQDLARRYLQRLVDINPDLMGHYAYENMSHEQLTNLIPALSPNSHAYLFIRRLKRQDKISQLLKFKKQTLLFYFESLCKYKPQHRILHQIEHQDYPRQYYIQSLALLKKYKFRQCQAYFLLPSESFSIYKQVYINRFAIQLQKLIYFKYSNANDYQRIIKSIFKMLIKVGNQLQFFRFVITQFNLPSKKKNFKTIGKQIQDIADKKGMKDNNFINKIRDMIQGFLNICGQKVKKEQLIQFLLEYKQVFELKFMVSIINTTLSKLNLNVTIYSTIQSIIHNDDVDKFDKIIQFKGSTFYCKPICRSCGLFLTDGLSTAILFECGHCFHFECAVNYELCQLCNENMFSRGSEIRRTVLLEQSRRRNKSVFRQIQVNTVDSYAAFDQMLEKEKQNQQDWSLPVRVTQ